MTRRHHSGRRSSRQHVSSASEHINHRSSGHVHHPRASDPEYEPVIVDLRSRDGGQSQSRYRGAASYSLSRASSHIGSNSHGYSSSHPRFDFEEQVPDSRFDVDDASSSSETLVNSPPRSHHMSHSSYPSRSSHHNDSHHNDSHRSHVSSTTSGVLFTSSWAYVRNVPDSRSESRRRGDVPSQNQELQLYRGDRHGLGDLNQYQELERYRQASPQRGSHEYRNNYIRDQTRQSPSQRQRYENDDRRFYSQAEEDSYRRAEERYPRNGRCPAGYNAKGPFY